MSNILLIDDDNDFKDTFLIKVQAEGYNLIHKTSFEGLQQIMPQVHHKIVAVVLDIKCLIKDDQPIENENFIGIATRYLDINYPNFPRIVLTGDDDAFEGYRRYTDGEHVFQKNSNGLKNTLVQLKYFADHSEQLKIKRNHITVFKLFENGYYDANTERTLLEVLKSIDESDFNKFGGILRNIRALQETIYKVINAKNVLVVPNDKFQSNGMIKFNDLMAHLNGNPDRRWQATTPVYQNSAIFNMANSLYWASGKYIHADPTETYEISNYTIKSLTHSLMELFLWSKKYVE